MGHREHKFRCSRNVNSGGSPWMAFSDYVRKIYIQSFYFKEECVKEEREGGLWDCGGFDTPIPVSPNYHNDQHRVDGGRFLIPSRRSERFNKFSTLKRCLLGFYDPPIGATHSLWELWKRRIASCSFQILELSNHKISQSGSLILFFLFRFHIVDRLSFCVSWKFFPWKWEYSIEQVWLN